MQAWDRRVTRCLRAAETGRFDRLKGACQWFEGDQAEIPGGGSLPGEKLGMVIVRMLMVILLKGWALGIVGRSLVAGRLIVMMMAVMVPIVVVVMMVARV